MAAGIGTQALALAARGFDVLAADLSPRAVRRARREAFLRGLDPPAVAADFRWLPFASGKAPVLIACDNALPHLLSLSKIRRALPATVLLTHTAREGGHAGRVSDGT